MEKNYCPVRIKNPNTKDCLIRLLGGQKLLVAFVGKNFYEYKLELNSDYLAVEEMRKTPHGWEISIAQKTELIHYHDSTLYLGNVIFYDDADECKASLCVVTQNDNNDYLRVIDPKNTSCNLSPNQVLDVVMHGTFFERWQASCLGQNLQLELIQHFVRHSKTAAHDPLEFFFRFRFDHNSINFLANLPFAKHSGGKITFINSKNERRNIDVTCCWRGKDSIYKALLLPKFANNSHFPIDKNLKKTCKKAVVELQRIESEGLYDGCTVLLSKA